MLDDADVLDLRVGNLADARVLFNKYSPLLQRKLSRLIPDPDDRDDIIQRTWISVLRNSHQLTNRENIQYWIWRICRNNATDFLRASQRRSKLLQRYKQAESTGPHINQNDTDEERADITKAEIVHIVCSFPRRQFEVASLRWFFGLSTNESANILEIAPGTVKATLGHARAKLQQLCLDGTAHLTKPTARIVVFVCAAILFPQSEAMYC